ncbi:MAG: response regulator transcription factor [Gammaproteobacteria bacterium]|nr:response regulator transcription factor [Gammaproteobacteria bacterium]
MRPVRQEGTQSPVSASCSSPCCRLDLYAGCRIFVTGRTTSKRIVLPASNETSSPCVSITVDHHILVIEDDPAIGQLLSAQLTGPGTVVEVQRDGLEGLRRAAMGRWNLYIVDRMLPDTDGVTLCRALRLRDAATPVIFLTARDTETDRIEGLDAGADDYIGKPFGMAEVQARVRAQLRRGARPGPDPDQDGQDEPLEIGGIRIDPRVRMAWLAARPVALTDRECRLLHHLMRHRDRAWSREQLLNRIWGPGYDGYAHTVNSHINRLRAKIEPDPARPRFILTTWGTGYRFCAASE